MLLEDKKIYQKMRPYAVAYFLFESLFIINRSYLQYSDLHIMLLQMNFTSHFNVKLMHRYPRLIKQD